MLCDKFNEFIRSLENFSNNYAGIINLLNITATLIIALSALWLSFIGTSINSRMENAALYKRRQEIQDAANQQLGMALFHPNDGKKEYFRFLSLKDESRFFFGVEVVDQLNKVSSFVGKLYNLDNKYKGDLPSDEFAGYLKEANLLRETLDKKIEPYYEISARKP